MPWIVHLYIGKTGIFQGLRAVANKIPLVEFHAVNSVTDHGNRLGGEAKSHEHMLHLKERAFSRI